MAKSNRDRISDVMDALKDGLGPFVLREYKQTYKAARYLQEVELTLNSNSYSPPHLPDEPTALAEIDIQGWLKLMWNNWNEVFKSKLSPVDRNYVSELMTARNDWAHQKAFANEDAYRVADTAHRLLSSIVAPRQAQTVRDIAQELLRLRFEAEQKQAAKPAAPRIDEAPLLTTRGLKPWRLVVQPHPDVASGRYLQAEFAADLAQVVQGKADPEYGDPREFFRRTYLTEGLLDLLVTGVQRLCGMGGDPVVQLQTSFGGGKTHSMLALYHLLGGEIGISEIPGGEGIISRVGEIDDRITARRAVIVGTAFSATEPRVHADATTHTMWGEIAYQIGGVEAYRVVERADLAGVSPGSDTVLKLLEDYGPVLIIVDELVAFARNLYNATERMSAGTFDSVMTFMQALTEAVRRSSDSMILISIPESDIEVGGDGGQATLEILAKIVGRIESVWKPVTSTESFEIVRRRLFSSEIDFASRDAVVSAFRDMYASNSSEFPSGMSDGDYFSRMKAAYPIHPELFARLYEDWSTLDRFQKTRGVLRLMSSVIHRLWQDNDQSLMIMPASMPLWASTVRNEILRYLPENWPAIVDADIDGEDSKTYQLDKSIPTLGQYTASRRVARAIFMGSAPSVTAQAVRGVEEVRIRLATVQPGEQLAAFNDALRRMSNQLTYLYTDGSRYWYDTRPTVNRMAQDRAQTIHPDKVYEEAVKRLRAMSFNKRDFTAAHVAPQGSADVADTDAVRVVVLPPDKTHRRNNGTSPAEALAREILESRDKAPRLYRNMLVFIAADATNAEAWERSLREYLAWKSIEGEAEPLNLDAQQRKQVATSVKTAEQTVESRLQETYSWLIVPNQPDPTGPIELQSQRIGGENSFYERAARKLRGAEQLITGWSPDNLLIELNNYLWRDQNHVGLKQLWDYFARYCYLPRLYNQDVLQQAVQDGATREDAPFAYATAVDSDGVYRGLVFRKPGQIYFDGSSVVLRPDIAQAQIDAAAAVHPIGNGSDGYQPGDTRGPKPPVGGETRGGRDSQPPAPEVKSRFHGSVSLDPLKVTREVNTIVQEVLQHLSALPGCAVDIRLEITARKPDGFDEATMRVVGENSRVLRFDNAGFERE